MVMGMPAIFRMCQLALVIVLSLDAIQGFEIKHSCFHSSLHAIRSRKYEIFM